MSITHDIYLFDPERFVTDSLPFVPPPGQPGEGYPALRARALGAYEQDAGVRKLADLYGGWDLHALQTQVPSESPESTDDVAFWHVLLLYRHLVPPRPPTPPGLQGDWRLMDTALERLGWTPAERSLLIKGRSFRELAESLGRRSGPAGVADAWLPVGGRIHPPSTAGHAGWLDLSDVRSLRERLDVDSARLGASPAGRDGDAETAAVQAVWDKARELLLAAEAAGLGLCIILSG